MPQQHVCSEIKNRFAGNSAAEIVDSIRVLVRTEQLKPGRTLPSGRELTAVPGVNANAVAAAYKRLVSARIVLARGRLGTVIRRARS
ncbi:GntR family transcriptional regulator [Paraburkholderia denitrificans]|uniref:GntR family transcriptional regulator n=1 Tax=Paraburkholderia denitrificans TaxID=694025 RepID=A0ABW0J492_9BURK